MEQDNRIKRKEIVSLFLKNRALVSPDILEQLEKESAESLGRLISKKNSEDILVFDKNTKQRQEATSDGVNWQEIERSKAFFEKGRLKLSQTETHIAQKPTESARQNNTKTIFSYTDESKKREVQDFVKLFNHRYVAIEKLLRNRQELQSTTSIKRISSKKEREGVCFIGMVTGKKQTKNNNLALTLEDPTGTINVIINKNRPELFEAARSIVLDEVIGVTGTNGDRIVFANNLLWPEVPITKELKKSHDEAYALFLSDLHVGSKNFLYEDFNRFIKWLNGNTGSDKQKEISSKVKYAFIAGDLVDGCGVYPDQEKELDIDDIYRQYAACADLLSQFPKEVQIILCPGNHDAMRIAEPQPPLYTDFAKPIYALKNTTIVSNPAIVNIHSSENFSGFDVLLYHGYSFDYFVSNVDSIRTKGGYDRADIIMKFLLKRRHLAPTHTSTLYIPDTNRDPLVIEKIPDFFATGHIHKSIVANYRNITLVSGSCWQSKTAFQEKVGHNPEPSRVPAINLMTREAKILKFGK